MTTRRLLPFVIVILALAFSACQPAAQEATATPEPPTAPAPVEEFPDDDEFFEEDDFLPVADELSICLGGEPNTLYPLALPNSAARAVLAALYDGPLDVEYFEYVPTILETLPSLEAGDAQLAPVTVSDGDLVMDSNGNLVQLTSGTRLFPVGCRTSACAQAYTGGEFEMEQMIVTFTLLPDVLWSDGTPLTAYDSVFAYELSLDSATPNSKFVVDRTQAYEALDDLSVQWWGIPGYFDTEYVSNFWFPVPAHAWQGLTPLQLAQADLSTRPPLGWGAYEFVDWIPGDSIILQANPFYYRAEEGLPAISTLIFRFMPDANQAIAGLLSGECDLLDPGIRLETQLSLLSQLADAGQIALYVAPTMTMERLDFGIRPASYDNGYNPAPGGDRPDLFGDPLTRQAIAYCLDRQAVVDTVLLGYSIVPDTFVPFDHPLYNPEVAIYSYDPDTALAFLQDAGWVDHDDDPSTPVRAEFVENVPAGTELVVNYLTSTAVQRRQASEILAQSLRACGVGVNLTYLPAETLYAEGPEGPLFGRNFDLIQFAMSTPGTQPPCQWYLNGEIPNAQNEWIGTNFSGYASVEYDTACRLAVRALPDEPEYQQGFWDAQAIFAEELPSIPLYQRLKVAATRPDLCGFNLDGSAFYDLYTIELLGVGGACFE
jgi:peptide/nickel transport system substrate-binding protein